MSESPFSEQIDPTLGALIDSVPAILWVTDTSGACTLVNRYWQEFTGQPVSAALGDGWAALVHPDDRQLSRQTLGAARERREALSVDFRLRCASGEHRWVATSARPYFGPGGEFVGLMGVAFDIDSRKRAELTLRRTQQMARFLANASVALADMSNDRHILEKVASLAVPFFADWCAVDLLRDGDSVERLLVAHSEPQAKAHAQEIARRWFPTLSDERGPGRVIASGTSEIVESISEPAQALWTNDPARLQMLGEVGLASYICVPLRWGAKTRAALTFVMARPERGYARGDLDVAEDLAQRVSAAIENAELYRLSVQADRRKDEFLAVLSHELRTPLTAIVGWAQILRGGAATGEVVRKAADTIHRNALLQTQLISDILDISRIVAGKLRLDVRSVELPVIIEAALDTLRPAADARRVRVERILDPGAGPISGDAGRLQQIVWNLVSNAIKFVPEKTGKVQVRLEAVNSHVRLTVEDNGPGIDVSFLPHAFERFRQADSSGSRTHQGLGLGLAITRQLVELHGGTVRAENRMDGGGAILTVDFPRRSVTEAASQKEHVQRHPNVAPPASPAPRAVLEDVRVLVVDDQEDARELFKAVLEHAGATVLVAASAAEALVYVRAEKLQLILTDLEMPEQSGYDLLRQVRALPVHQGGATPAVALTAYATAHDRVETLRAGFQMHVTKPVEPAELIAVISALTKTLNP